MHPEHLEYLFKKVERDAFKLEEIQGISAETLAEILKVILIAKDEASHGEPYPPPVGNTDGYTGPFPTGKCFSRGVPLRAIRDSSNSPRLLQFKASQLLILTEKNDSVAKGYVQSDPHKRTGEINLQDVQFVLRFEDEYFAEVDAFASSLDERYAQDIRQLAEHLTHPYEDSTIFQLRSIYTWICYHITYDVESFFGSSGAMRSNEARDVLRSRLGVCAGYSNLFQALCEAIPPLARAVRPKGVNGYGRVSIDGQPFFIESTWGAGYLDNGTFVRKFVGFYFLSNPQDFVRLHFPSNASDQQLTPAVTEDEFCAFPLFFPHFYKYDLALVSHNTSPITLAPDDYRGGKRVTIKLRVPPEIASHVYFSAKLSCTSPADISPPVEVFSQPSMEGYDLYIPPVVWELATLDVFLFDKTKNALSGESVMQLAIRSKLHTEGNYCSLPRACNLSDSSSLILITPLTNALTLHSAQAFKLRPKLNPKYNTDGALYLMNPKRRVDMLRFDWAEGVYSITSNLSFAGEWNINLKTSDGMYRPLYIYNVS